MALNEFTPAGRKVTVITATVACLAVVGVGFFWLRSWQRSVRTQPLLVKTEHAPQPQPSGQATSIASLRLILDGTLRGLGSASDPGAARLRFEDLRRSLQTLPAAAASAVIREFLDSKADASSRLPFKVGADGFLTESPSLRVFLLDYLAQVDPAAAAAYATTILATMESPDEWAVALRSYAAMNPTSEGRKFLEPKLQAMLTHDAWVSEPSTGFLEAFDVAVYVGGTKSLPALTALVRRTNNEAVAHASYLALDRLTIQDPVTALAALQATPEWMRGREVTRANYFARADVREVRQRQILEEYLLSPDRTPAELQAFSGLYPNANLMVSPNLLTRVRSPDHAELVRRDIAALRVVQEWLADPRFEPLKPSLEKIRIRLEVFVRQARSGQ